MKFTTIPTKYDDQYIRRTIVYGDESDQCVYVDKAKTEKVSPTDLEEIFYAAMAILCDGKYYVPTCMSKTGLDVTVSVIKDGNTVVEFKAGSGEE